MDRILAAAPAAMTVTDIHGAVHEILAFHRAHIRAHPHLAEVFYNSGAIGFMPDPHQSRAAFAERLHGALVGRKLLRADCDPLVSVLAVELGDRVLEMVHQAGTNGDDAILAEGERALAGYLQNHSVS